jgi:hypothetical protein
MDAFDRHAIAELCAPRSGHCASLSMPRGHTWAESAQDRIRFKNLLHLVEAGLVERGVQQEAARQMLADGWKLQANEAAWKAPGAGLAAFAADGFFRAYAVPVALVEAAAVDRRSLLAPLAPLIEPEAAWYLLAASQKEARLFRADRFSIHAVDVPGMPLDLDRALNFDRHDRVVQFHGAVAHGKGRRSSVFHGQGGAPDDAKDDMLAYFRIIDRAMHGVLQNRHEPLVFAGVDYLFPLYREANTYSSLAEEHAAGNPDDLSAEELHRRAWPLIAARFEARRDEGLHRVAAGRRGDVVANFDQVLAAAEQGRVDTLFFDAEKRRWGEWDAVAQRARTFDAPRPGAEELVNRALVDTLRQGGRAWAAPAARLPPGEPLAALLRFAS